VAESNGIVIKTVLRGGAAESAGFAAGDEWLGLEVGTAKSATHWRLSKLDDLLLYAGTATQVIALVARDKRLLKLALTLPKTVTTWRLVARDGQRVGQWLNAA
jgi:S1-C subfamily serine protease